MARQHARHSEAGLTEHWQVVVFEPLWKFDSSDFDRAIAEMSSRQHPDDCLVALSIALFVYVNSGQEMLRKQTLMTSATEPILADRLTSYLLPKPVSEESKRHAEFEQKWKAEAEERRLTQKKNEEGWQIYLRKPETVAALRDPRPKLQGDISNAQRYLHQLLRENANSSGKWTNSNCQAIATKFGQETAEAFREGLMYYWRNFRPQLLSEGAAQNSTPLKVLFGLTGIEIESQQKPQWALSLAADEVVLACR